MIRGDNESMAMVALAQARVSDTQKLGLTLHQAESR